MATLRVEYHVWLNLHVHRYRTKAVDALNLGAEDRTKLIDCFIYQSELAFRRGDQHFNGQFDRFAHAPVTSRGFDIERFCRVIVD